MDLNNTNILITGGSSGLGAACVHAFKNYTNSIKSIDSINSIEQQSNIIILDKNIELLDSESITPSNNKNIISIECDVSNAASVEQAFAEIQERAIIPRIIINCAGIAPAKRIVGKSGPMPFYEFTNCIDINLNGTFNVLRTAAHFISQLDPVNNYGERGVIINTASIAAYEGQIGQAAYSASKAGIIGLTLPAARELARFGIRVNTIAPGVFATNIIHDMPQNMQDALINNIPFPKRLGKPEEFASLVKEIINNPMLNGTTIRLDGALRMN